MRSATRLEGFLIAAGESAPDFTLLDADGNAVRLADLRGRPVVLYFYPKDDTPGCTKEACAFRDARAELGASQAVVLGISPDSSASHARFRSKYGLDFTLLSDPDKAVSERYGAFGDKVLYGKKTRGMIRSTFVIDAAGVVRKVFPRVRVDGHVAQVLKALAAL
jgi:peroxiredoxin Q/BCP